MIIPPICRFAVYKIIKWFGKFILHNWFFFNLYFLHFIIHIFFNSRLQTTVFSFLFYNTSDSYRYLCVYNAKRMTESNKLLAIPLIRLLIPVDFDQIIDKCVSNGSRRKRKIVLKIIISLFWYIFYFYKLNNLEVIVNGSNKY